MKSGKSEPQSGESGSKHEIRFADARDLDFLGDGCVDLVVTSPPYPMIEMWDGAFSAMNPAVGEALEAGDGRGAFGRMHGELDRVWEALARVVGPGGIVCVNVGDATRTVGEVFRLYANASRILETFVRLGFDALPKILWRKPTNAPNKFMGSGMLPVSAYVTLEHETILVLRKGPNRRFETKETKARRRESAFFWEERNRWFSDVWDLKGTRQAMAEGEARDRSGAFPFELPYRLVNMYSVKGDKVLDPFVGTGTTTLAAMASERNSVGVEIDFRFAPVIRRDPGRMRDELNGFIEERLARHEAFVREYTEKKKKDLYHNPHHDFGVVTRQETDLKIRTVREIRDEDRGFEVLYMP
ncbi:MAG: DNA-methyltransferase [Planctomycetota bacterium]|jgi:DNA modification methylase